ncbi:MAG TPA: hypothetical protein VHH88_13565, partial [Verrucomicrobiae bacterium]|nr:hypothetical protein [Verrucomicrobiae bacterium]
MNALIRKEFRLLLPAFAAAFVLVAVSGCLGTPAFPTGIAVWLGTALIGISCFGREFQSNTFSLLLTLPIPRQKIWWIKIGALLMLLCVLWLERIGMRLIFGFEAWSDWASVVCVLLATLGGALWTTLLLRESLAAFCVALLLPVSIFAVEDMAKVPAGIIFASLALYGAAGPVFAWRLFQRAQDVGWTGGEVAVRLAPFAGWKTRAARRTFHPFGALFRKEAKLHQPACLMILGLLVLHFAAILARTAMRSDQNSLAGETLSVFSGFWLIVPLAVGAVGIAEERKLGTLQQATTLPFRRNIQFGLKLLFPVFLGGLLSPLLVVVAEGIATTIGAPARIPLFDPAFSLHALGWLILVFSGLSLAGVYASSLSSSFVQALTLGVGISG